MSYFLDYILPFILVLGLDIQDEMGRHEVGFVENTLKTPLGPDKKGCRFEGRFYVNKVSVFSF